MISYYDDNFGFYEPSDDPEADAEFYQQMQELSIEKRCSGCDRLVRIKHDYAYCNSCADKRERGFDL
jgi:hypothetical protein